jgi:hypothetical protein
MPQILDGPLTSRLYFNTDNTSDNTRHFIRSSKHFTFLSSVFPLNTPHTGSNTADSVRTQARFTLLHQPCKVSPTEIFTAMYSELTNYI